MLDDSGRELGADLGQVGRLFGVVQNRGTGGAVPEGEMDVDTVSRSFGVQKGREGCGSTTSSREIPDQVPEDDGAVGRFQGTGGPEGDLELIPAVLGQPRLRLQPHVVEKIHQVGPERLRRPEPFEGERGGFLGTGHAELVLEGGHDLQTGQLLEFVESIACERPRAALPRGTIRKGLVRKVEVQARSFPVGRHGHHGTGVGNQAKITCRPENIVLRDASERPDGQVRRNPSDAFGQHRRRFLPGNRTSSGLCRDVVGCDESQG